MRLRTKKLEFLTYRTGNEYHGTPINLCVCNESRKRSGCAFA
jgi:hypothetical protein